MQYTVIPTKLFICQFIKSLTPVPISHGGSAILHFKGIHVWVCFIIVKAYWRLLIILGARKTTGKVESELTLHDCATTVQNIVVYLIL
jgi:hypothetical protein